MREMLGNFAAVYLAAVAMVAAYCGQHVVRKIIALLGRASIIIFVLAFTIFISSLTLGMFTNHFLITFFLIKKSLNYLISKLLILCLMVFFKKKIYLMGYFFEVPDLLNTNLYYVSEHFLIFQFCIYIYFWILKKCQIDTKLKIKGMFGTQSGFCFMLSDSLNLVNMQLTDVFLMTELFLPFARWGWYIKVDPTTSTK